MISSMVDIRTSCYAARLAAFSCPQKHWKALIFRGALKKVAIPAISGGRPSPLPSVMEINGNRSPACFGGGAIRSEMNLRLKDSRIVWSA